MWAINHVDWLKHPIKKAAFAAFLTYTLAAYCKQVPRRWPIVTGTELERPASQAMPADFGNTTITVEPK